MIYLYKLNIDGINRLHYDKTIQFKTVELAMAEIHTRR